LLSIAEYESGFMKKIFIYLYHNIRVYKKVVGIPDDLSNVNEI